MSELLIISKNSTLSRYFNFRKFDANYVTNEEFLDQNLSNVKCVINLGRSSDFNHFHKIIEKVSKSNSNYIHSSSISVLNKKDWNVTAYKKIKINEEKYIKSQLASERYKILRIGHIIGFEFILSSILIKMLFDGKCCIPDKISNVVYPSELIYLVKDLQSNWKNYSNIITCVSNTKITWYNLIKKHLIHFNTEKEINISDRLIIDENYKYKSDFIKIINSIKLNVKIDVLSIIYVELSIYLNNLKNKFVKKKNIKKLNSIYIKDKQTNHFLFDEKVLETSLNFELNNNEYEKDIKHSVLSFFGKNI